MINIEQDDEPEFVAQVGAVVKKVLTQFNPGELIVVKVDNWFDHKWLKFSGKMFGAVGIWKEELTLPPFSPNRIVWERRFSSAANMATEEQPLLHISTPASEAVKRKVSKIAPDAAIVWFSGRSKDNARGSMISYIPTSEDHWTWYAGWSRAHSWSENTLKGISRNELLGLLNTALSHE